MGKFEGRLKVKVGATWPRILQWQAPSRGYFGKSAPQARNVTWRWQRLSLQPGEVLKTMTTQSVISQWVHSLRRSGQTVEVIEADGYITVRSPASPSSG